VATATVRELCRLAAAQYGLRTLTAAATHENVASQRVLAKAGFGPAVPAGPAGTAGTADIGGCAGTRYQLDLAAGSRS
jgi:[ribosomal protein S5]-alanine N-acetyltransferase